MGSHSKSSLARLVVFIILHALCFSCGCAGSRSGGSGEGLVLAKLAQGQVVGQLRRKASVFWGIPYSQPPVGEYRWKNPRDPIPFETEYYNATYKRPGCIQRCGIPSIRRYMCPQETSEDCLFLNVFVPRRIIETSLNTTQFHRYRIMNECKNNSSKSLAVMVYIHGGSFAFGAGSAVSSNGRDLAHIGNVIVVTINYRLGPLGFLVQGSGNDTAKGNYGIMDQIKALEWVKNNIQHFGGNPEKITLFGAKAGAESIGILATSPLGKRLFHKAIYQSDPLSLPLRSLQEANNFGDRMAEEFECEPGDLKCLRKQDAGNITRVGLEMVKRFRYSSEKATFVFQVWAPVIDGKVVHGQPIERFVKGDFHRMPVIMGAAVGDASPLVYTDFRNKFRNTDLEHIWHIFQFPPSTVRRQYPKCSSPSCDNRETLSKMATDYVFVCGARKALSQMGPLGWFYNFNVTTPTKGSLGSKVCSISVCHGMELPYVFGSPRLNLYSDKNDHLSLVKVVQHYWSNFAKYGNPNGASEDANGIAEYWSPFMDPESSSCNTMKFTSRGNFMLSNSYNENCDFWDELDVYGKSQM